MRGLAILVMIQCHTFNSFTRLDLRNGGPYVMTQFIGGMAAPLFLFMAGMTTGFQMESLERREARGVRRWRTALRRAGYILGIAFTFRFTNWVFAWPWGDWHEMLRVDILNSMGASMAVLAAAALLRGADRIRFTLSAGVVIAAIAPVVANADWRGVPAIVQEYLAAAPGRRFPLFPWAAYVAFGMGTGEIVKRTAENRLERSMQWCVLVGFALIFTSQYFSNLPYSIYDKSSFWLDSPTLVLIRVGVILLSLAGAYLWTVYGVHPGRWSWMQTLGRNSLMVYWVHVMIVYGSVLQPLKRTFSIARGALMTLLVTILMLGLSMAWEHWKRRKERKKAGETPAWPSPDCEPAKTRP